MTDTFTANYNLRKIEYDTSGDTWGTKTNANLDLIDSALNTLATGKQPLDADLTQIAGLSAPNGTFLVKWSDAWNYGDAAFCRTRLGLGDMAQASSANYRNNTQNDARYLQNDPGFGAVGSLALVARVTAGGVTLSPGTLVSAADINAVGFYFRQDPSPTMLGFTGMPLTGTWRLMGYLLTNNSGGGTGFAFTLAQRAY